MNIIIERIAYIFVFMVTVIPFQIMAAQHEDDRFVIPGLLVFILYGTLKSHAKKIVDKGVNSEKCSIFLRVGKVIKFIDEFLTAAICLIVCCFSLLFGGWKAFFIAVTILIATGFYAFIVFDNESI